LFRLISLRQDHGDRESNSGQGADCPGLAKEAVKLASRSNLDEGLRREVDLFALCFATEDKDEGVKAFLEKRKLNSRDGKEW